MIKLKAKIVNRKGGAKRPKNLFFFILKTVFIIIDFLTMRIVAFKTLKSHFLNLGSFPLIN